MDTDNSVVMPKEGEAGIGGSGQRGLGGWGKSVIMLTLKF